MTLAVGGAQRPRHAIERGGKLPAHPKLVYRQIWRWIISCCHDLVPISGCWRCWAAGIGRHRNALLIDAIFRLPLQGEIIFFPTKRALPWADIERTFGAGSRRAAARVRRRCARWRDSGSSRTGCGSQLAAWAFSPCYAHFVSPSRLSEPKPNQRALRFLGTVAASLCRGAGRNGDIAPLLQRAS